MRRELVFLSLLGLAMAQGPEKRRTGNICSVDMDCPDNAFCRLNSYCVCKEGYVYAAINSTQKGCLKEAHFGEQCVQNIQCHMTIGVHSECSEGVCTCTPTAHLDGERCYESALIGERCVVDQNCHIADQNGERQAFCVRGYCVCQLQYSPRDNGTRCVRDAGLGEECEDELQCAGTGLECKGTCRCKENWVVYNHTNTCVESVKGLNESCEFDVQCDGLSGAAGVPAPGAALCLGGACACAYSARPAGNPPRCWHVRRPGQDCRRDEECFSEEDEPGYCLNGRCTCKTCSPDAKDFFNSAPKFSLSMLPPAILLAAMLR